MDTPKGEFHVTVAHQSLEEEMVNGTETRIPSLGGSQRYPFLLMLDGIVSCLPILSR